MPEKHNPFGVFIRTPNVAAIAARVEDLIIRPGGLLRHRKWGLYEVGILGPEANTTRPAQNRAAMGSASFVVMLG